MDNRCLVPNNTTKRLYEEVKNDFPLDNEDSIRNNIALWQEANNADRDTYPTATELSNFIKVERGKNSVRWARTSNNNYEVSSHGDKRFSALFAQFKDGTIIDGTDVSGMTIEDVYQKVIKKSGKGLAPAKFSRLNLNPTSTSEEKRANFYNEVTEKYGNPVSYINNEGILTVTFERGAVEIIPFAGSVKDLSGKSLGNKDINYFIGTLKAVESLAGTAEDFSYREGYLPLWQEWASQNLELIQELRDKSKGKVLTDKFANTRVSQARALADILNSSNVGSENLIIVPTKDTARKAQEIGGIDTLRHPDKGGMHFGNPFSHTNYTGVQKVMPTVKDAVIAYEEWLRGTNYQDIEPERRQWIVNQINNGSLKGKPLVYYTETIPDNSYGTTIYNAITAPNHAHILQKLINEGIKSNTGEQVSVDNTKDIKTPKRASFTITDNITTEEQDILDATYDPQIKKDRISWVSRKFSVVLNDFVELEKNALQNLIDSTEGRERESYISELNNLTRLSVLKINTPEAIFEAIRKACEDYVNSTQEEKIQAELDYYRDVLGITDEYTEEELREAAEKKADYKTVEYSKLADPKIFWAIAKEAGDNLRVAEGCIIDVNYAALIEDELDALNEDGTNPTGEGDNDLIDREEVSKDNWMTNVREISSFDRLSQITRKFLSEIPKLDNEGYIEEDDLGEGRYIDADYAHKVFVDALKNMTRAEEMMPLLEELSNKHTWVFTVVEELEKEENEMLKSAFYVDFRLDYQDYWIQRSTIKADGSISTITKRANEAEGTKGMINSWSDNITNGIVLDREDSIYNKDGSLNQENADKGKQLNSNLYDRLTEALKESKDKRAAEIEFLEQEDVLNSISKMLRMVGIDLNPATVKTTLQDITVSKDIEIATPLSRVLQNLNTIFRGVNKNSSSRSRVTADGKINEAINPVQTYSSAYKGIASVFSSIREGALEGSTTENGKTYYAHTMPNYLGKLIKRLQNAMNVSDEEYKQWLESEYGRYALYKKKGIWRNDVLRQLDAGKIGDTTTRDKLEHKSLLHYNNVSYSDWDSLDYQCILFNEFNSAPENSKYSYAWYYMPIFSNNPSAEFIKLRKYTGTVYDEVTDTNRRYDEVIADKLSDVVLQEYDRIMEVRQRDVLYQQGDPTIEPIGNYDITRNSKGEIVNIGGAEFRFFPALNSYEINGIPFIDVLSDLVSESKITGSSEALNEFLRAAIFDIMENGFNEEYSKWEKIDFFEETADGSYKYLPYKGHSGYNSTLVKQLTEAKKVLGDTLDAEINDALKVLETNPAKLDSATKATIEAVKEALAERGSGIKLSNYIESRAVEALREYYWNNKLAVSQIVQLTVGDYAFTKGAEEFQKRFISQHSPGNKLYTEATYKGEKVGKPSQRVIYLADSIVVSSIYDDVKEVLGEGEVLDSYTEVNETDGQAFRSLSSYRAVNIMRGGNNWTEDHERAYNDYRNGISDSRDLTALFQVMKPITVSSIPKITSYEDKIVDYQEDGTPIFDKVPVYTRVPVYHKDSEFCLLSGYKKAGVLNKSIKMAALNKFMEDNNIDLAVFNSGVKTGVQGVIDINHKQSAIIDGKEVTYADYSKQVKDRLSKGEITGAEARELLSQFDYTSAEEIYDVLREATGIANNEENPNVVHEIPMEDYGIQQPTPQHGIDTEQLVSTQTRKLVPADISENAQFTIGNKTFSKEELLNLFNSLNVENVLQSYAGTQEDFSSMETIARLIQNELRGNPRYSNELKKACLLEDNGNFKIPLFDEMQSDRVQQLLNSSIKRAITKQKIKGGSMVQVSSYGLTDDLKIAFEGSGKNKRIKHFECYMPAYSQRFFEPLINPKTGLLDVRDLPEDLRRLIGLRIPTEDKYSILPLYIKGFLPQNAGTSIMLPADITLIMGSDFDIDKLYIMLPEFRVEKYDREGAKRAYKGTAADTLIDSLLGTNEVSESDSDGFNEWFDEHKEEYAYETPMLKKIKYDFNKSPVDNGLAARNNMIIDIIYSVLTNPDTASKMLNPGGFENQKKAAKVNYILENTNKESLKDILETNGITVGKDNVSSAVLDLPLNKLNKIASQLSAGIDPLVPSTQILFHQRNMTGAKMVGVYATHNSNHALMQHTKLQLKSSNTFRLNDEVKSSLHDIQNSNGEFISRIIARYLAASVDNPKTPTLADLNQNLFTADASMLLSALGYDVDIVGLFMAQPIIRDITATYFREQKSGASKEAVIDKVLSSYKKKAKVNSDLTYENFADRKFLKSELAENILIADDATTDRTSTTDFDALKFYNNQVAVGYLFKKVMIAADALSKVVQATRADTANGGAGPTLAATEIKRQKVEDLLEQSENPNFPLAFAKVIRNDITMDNIDEIRKELLNSPLPILQAFYTLGVQNTGKLLAPYFPHFRESFRSVVTALKNMTKANKLDEKTLKNIYKELFSYILTDTKFFGSETIIDSEGNEIYISAHDRRSDFINNFPDEFSRIVAENPDIADLTFIQSLRVITSNGLKIISFDNTGSKNNTVKDRISQSWESMLYMDNPEANKLAINLERYSSFRGLGFGHNNFNHLTPVAVKIATPEYIDKLRSLLTTTDDYSPFIDQYIYNNLHNRRFAPVISEEAPVEFIDKDGNLKDEIDVFITKGNKSSLSSIVKKENRNGEAVEYDFMNYFAKSYKGDYVYYRAVEFENAIDGSGTLVTYQRINPLGLKGGFVEYEYGKDVTEMESVLKTNELQKDSGPVRGFNDGFVDMEYESLSDDDMLPSFESLGEADIPAQAFKQVYNENLEESPVVDNDVTSIAPNDSFIDENGLEICN